MLLVKSKLTSETENTPQLKQLLYKDKIIVDKIGFQIPLLPML